MSITVLLLAMLKRICERCDICTFFTYLYISGYWSSSYEQMSMYTFNTLMYVHMYHVCIWGRLNEIEIRNYFISYYKYTCVKYVRNIYNMYCPGSNRDHWLAVIAEPSGRRLLYNHFESHDAFLRVAYVLLLPWKLIEID